MRSYALVGTARTSLGQMVRIGIEDNLWTTRNGQRMGSVDQVKKLVRIANELGRDVADGKQARDIMKIGTWYTSVEETLFNLGLPPNRREGQQGFLTYDTDGLLHPTYTEDEMPSDPTLIL
jgi:hypothetical protein